jgi:hypothetical protein
MARAGNTESRSTSSGEQLAELLRRAGRTPRSIARDAELGETVVRDIINGSVQDPRVSTLRALAKVLGPEVLAIWLGDLLPPPIGTAGAPIEMGAEMYLPVKVYDPEDYNPISVSLFRAGVLRDVSKMPLEELSVVRVADDAMAPTLQEGDHVVVHHIADGVDRDGLYAISAKGSRRLLVRRMRRRLGGTGLTVLCDNPRYPAEDLDEKSIVVRGRVRWFGRTLG